MRNFITQAQLLLAALSAVLPLAPAGKRAHLAHVLETIAAALKLGESAAAAGESLATKFAALRSEVEGMAALNEHASVEELEAVFARVRAASADFRAACAAPESA